MVPSTRFDADAWVQLAKQAGMKWITITSKHHDGFAIYDSPADSFDINATPFFAVPELGPPQRRLRLLDLSRQSPKQLHSIHGREAIPQVEHLSPEEAMRFRQVVHQASPGTIVNGRIGHGLGDYWSVGDNAIPSQPYGEVWETPMTTTAQGGDPQPLDRRRLRRQSAAERRPQPRKDSSVTTSSNCSGGWASGSR